MKPLALILAFAGGNLVGASGLWRWLASFRHPRTRAALKRLEKVDPPDGR